MTSSRKRRKSASAEDSEFAESFLSRKKKMFVLVPSKSDSTSTSTTTATALAMKEGTNDVELERLQAELARMKETVEAQNRTIEKARQGLRCNICLETLRLPQLLVPCGHVACYECLKAWFLNPPDNASELSFVSDEEEDGDVAPPPRNNGNANTNANANGAAAPNANANLNATRNVTRLKKHCPYCRVAVNNHPVPVYALRDLVDTIDPENAPKDSELPNDPWKDIFPPVKALNDASNGSNHNHNHNHNHNEQPGVARIDYLVSRLYTGPPPPPFYDSEDHVRRCGVCMHEIWGHTCSNERCGAIYPDDSEYHGESDEDYNDPLEWDGFPFGAIENVYHDGSYESSFIDDEDGDGDEDGDNYEVHRTFWPDNSFSHYNDEDMSDDDDDEEAPSGPARLQPTSRNRTRSSIIMEDEGEGEDDDDDDVIDMDDNHSVESSDDFITRAVLKERPNSFHRSMGSDEDIEDIEDESTIENDYWEDRSEHSEQIGRRGFSDDDGVIHEEDSDGAVSPAYSGGARNTRHHMLIRRRMVISDEDEEEGEDEDEEKICTPCRNHNRGRRGRRVMSDDDEDDGDDDDSEPVRPRGVRRQLLRTRVSEYNTHRRRR